MPAIDAEIGVQRKHSVLGPTLQCVIGKVPWTEVSETDDGSCSGWGMADLTTVGQVRQLNFGDPPMRREYVG